MAFGNANAVRNVGRGAFGNANAVQNVGRAAFGNANARWNTRKQTVLVKFEFFCVKTYCRGGSKLNRPYKQVV